MAIVNANALIAGVGGRVATASLVASARTTIAGQGGTPNYQRNPLSVGLVPGTPGTTPTFFSPWSNLGLNRDLSLQIINGEPFTVARFYGTTTTSGGLVLWLETNTGATELPALSGSPVTYSFDMILLAGALPTNTNTFSGQMMTQAFVPLASVVSPDMTTRLNATLATGVPARFTMTYTPNDATCAYVRWSISPARGTTIGMVDDFTIGFGYSQAEQGSVATPYILPPAGTTGVTYRALLAQPTAFIPVAAEMDAAGNLTVDGQVGIVAAEFDAVGNVYADAQPMRAAVAEIDGVGTPATFVRPSPATYYDAAGVLQIAPNDTLRWGYDRFTLAPIGPIIEAGSTNGVSNARLLGAVVGTPGTMPTNWQIGLIAGSSNQIVATGVQENGQPYVDYRVFGTLTGTGTGTVWFELTTTSYPALDQQTWTASVDVQLVGGTLPTQATQLQVQGVTSVNTQSFISATVNSNPSIRADRLTRISNTTVLAGGGATAKVRSRMTLHVGATAGTVLDFTLRYSCPQLEQTAAPTSIILPPPGIISPSTRAPEQSFTGAFDAPALLASESVEIDAVGNLAAAVRARLSAQPGIVAGVSDFQATAWVRAAAIAQIPGVGVLSAQPNLRSTASATLAGTGAVLADGIRQVPAAATIAGVGTVRADGLGRDLAAATLAGTGSVTGAAVATRPAAARIDGAGAINVNAGPARVAAATIAGAGSVAVIAAPARAAGARLAGVGSVTTPAVVSRQAAAKLSTEVATVWDPTTVLDPVATLLTDGNRTILGTPNVGVFDGAMGTVFQSAGKLYAEFTANANFDYGNCFGVAAPGANYSDLWLSGILGAIWEPTYGVYIHNVSTNVLTIEYAGQTIAMAVDLDNDRIWFRLLPNGQWNGSPTADPGLPSTGLNLASIPSQQLRPVVQMAEGSAGGTLNAGTVPFLAAPPAGYTGWPAPGHVQADAIRIAQLRPGGSVIQGGESNHIWTNDFYINPPNQCVLSTDINPPPLAGTFLLKHTRIGATGDNNTGWLYTQFGSTPTGVPYTVRVSVWLPAGWGGTQISFSVEGPIPYAAGFVNLALLNQWQVVSFQTDAPTGDFPVVCRVNDATASPFYTADWRAIPDTVSAAPTLIATGAGQLPGEGTVLAPAVSRLLTQAQLAGVSNLAATGAARVPVQATIPGDGGVRADARPARPAQAEFDGAGTLGASALVVARAQATIAGEGSVTSFESARQVAAATLAGEGFVGVDGYSPGQLVITGDSNLRATATIVASEAVTIAGIGTVRGAYAGLSFAAAEIDGVSDLRVGVPSSTAGPHVVIPGVGRLAATPNFHRIAGAAPTGISHLAADAVPTVFVGVRIWPEGQLIARPTALLLAAARIGGQGALRADGSEGRAALARIAGTGQLQATATFRGKLYAAAKLDGTGTLKADADPLEIARAAATLAGTGRLAASGQRIDATGFHYAAARITGVGTISATPFVRVQAAARINGVGGLGAATVPTEFEPAAHIAGTGRVVDTNLNFIRIAGAAPTGISRLEIRGDYPATFVGARLWPEGQLIARPLVTRVASARLGVAGRFDAQASASAILAATIGSSGQLAADAIVVQSVAPATLFADCLIAGEGSFPADHPWDDELVRAASGQSPIYVLAGAFATLNGEGRFTDYRGQPIHDEAALGGRTQVTRALAGVMQGAISFAGRLRAPAWLTGKVQGDQD